MGKSQYRSHSSHLLTFTNNDDDDDDYNAYLLCVYIILASGVCFKKARKIPALWGKKDNQYNIETVYVVFQSDICDGEKK